MIACAICFAAEFAILPPDNNISGACLAEILPPDAGIDIADPLAGSDQIRFQICNICEKKLRTKILLHDITYGVDGIG